MLVIGIMIGIWTVVADLVLLSLVKKFGGAMNTNPKYSPLLKQTTKDRLERLRKIDHQKWLKHKAIWEANAADTRRGRVINLKTKQVIDEGIDTKKW